MLPDPELTPGEAMNDEPAPESSSVHSLSLSSDILTEAGLSHLKPGDVVYVPMKVQIDGDEQGVVSGISIQALGTPMETPPEEGSLVDIESVESEEPVIEEETADLSEEDEAPSDEAAPEAIDEDDAEEKMLGYKRPKAPKAKMPKAKDFLMGDE